MSYVGADVMLDFVSSLAVLGLLVIGFSALAPNLKKGWFGETSLGVIFGLVVVLQMSMPLSPADGVIIDMRHVPIALAGAFLGLRGLATCLTIAIATRWGIGGVGLVPGVVGMTIAGGVGYAWSLLSPRLQAHDRSKLILLGLTVNLHSLSAFLAPAPIATWYFLEAVPTIFVLNLVCTPAIGWLLLREQVLAQRLLATTGEVDPGTRLLTAEAFSKEVFHYGASDPGTRIEGVIAVTLKNANWMARTWGPQAVDQALGALRIRMAHRCNDTRPLGIDRNRRVLVPVTATEMGDLRPFRRALRAAAAEEPILFDGAISVPLSVMVESIRLRAPDAPAGILKDIRQSAATRRTANRRGTAQTKGGASARDVPAPAGLCVNTLSRMFDQAEAQMQKTAARS